MFIHLTTKEELIHAGNLVAYAMNNIAKMNDDHEEFSPIQLTNMEGLLLVWRNCKNQLRDVYEMTEDEINNHLVTPDY